MKKVNPKPIPSEKIAQHKLLVKVLETFNLFGEETSPKDWEMEVSLSPRSININLEKR